MTDESEQFDMEFDVIIVGAGPAGLSAAIRLRQGAAQYGRDLSVCVVEKGAEVGAHILSGAVFDPRALDELIPQWRERGAPLDTPVKKDVLALLGRNFALPLPVPRPMKNHGNYIVSMGRLTRWLGEQAEALGVEIFAGFAATEILFNGERVCGIVTGDMGREKTGTPGPRFQPGTKLGATYTLFAEGCRGSLSENIIKHFSLRKNCQPQTYGLGIKEIWEIDPALHKAGRVAHTIGWPLGSATYGGGFLYHLENNQLAVGMVVGLDYANPYLDPFAELQRLKTHPAVRNLLEGARRIAYGARTLNEGGWQSLPELVFPGGALIGAAAGFMNVARFKGSHTAMKSGMLAADAVLHAFANADANTQITPAILDSYPQALRASWVNEELYKARNIRPAFQKGLWAGLVYSALDLFLLRGHAPWTFSHKGPDHEHLAHASNNKRIDYPKADGVRTFDRPSSLHLATLHHDDRQPDHLLLTAPETFVPVNHVLYDGPETRYCPAGVYEYIHGEKDGNPTAHLQINAQNCLHCKACDIKDPRGAIRWTPPEGGSGPNYAAM